MFYCEEKTIKEIAEKLKFSTSKVKAIFVFYGIGHTQYKEELDEIVNFLEEEMK